MFEFTEDKKGLRPKYIGTIRNDAVRKSLIAFMVLPTITAVISLNIMAFIYCIVIAFWKLILLGTYNILAGLFSAKTWESWKNPRERKND